jgi:hypothetical protein
VADRELRRRSHPANPAFWATALAPGPTDPGFWDDLAHEGDPLPLGLRLTGSALPAPLSMPVPPVAMPGTSENDAFVKDVLTIWKMIRNALSRSSGDAGPSCKEHRTRCLHTSLADLPGGGYGDSRCQLCFDECMRNNGVWPDIARPASGAVRCDYWNFQ